MNDSTQQDPQGPGGGAGPDVDVAATTSTASQATQQGSAGTGPWPDVADDPGSGVPGGGRHKYASGKIYCGTEN